MNPTIKFSIIFLFFVFNFTDGYSQSFYKTFDLGLNPDIVSCTERIDGGFLLLLESEIPYTDYCYLISIDINGQVAWTKRLDFPNSDVIPLMIRSNADSTYTILINSLPKPSSGERGAMLLTIDGNANIIWMNTYGENTSGNRAMPLTFTRTTSGNFVIAGQRQYNGNAYPALIVTDSIGNFLWAKSYDFSIGGIGLFRVAQQTPDGGLIICGDGKPYGFLLKTDSVGNIQWYRKYHNNNVGVADFYSVAVSSDSCYMAYGITSSTQGYTFLMKVNAIGDTMWVKVYDFYSPFIKPFPVYESGGNFSFLSNVEFGANSNTTRFNISKVDSNGNLIFSKLYHPSMKNWMSDMQLTSSNGLIVSGYITDTVTMDKHGFFMKSYNAITTECRMDFVTYATYNHTFNVDTGSVAQSFSGDAIPAAIISSDNISDNNLCVPVSVDESRVNQFTIEPNPSAESFSISSSQDLLNSIESISILDVLGNVNSRNVFTGQYPSVNVSGLSTGIYFCKIELTDGKTIVKKIIVSR